MAILNSIEIRGRVLNLFPDRKLTVLKCLAENDCVVLEQEWQGTFALTAGESYCRGNSKTQSGIFFHPG